MEREGGRKKNTSSMRDGGGRLAGFVGALVQGGIRVGSSPCVGRRWREVRDAAVRRGVVPLLHRPRPHRTNPHAPAPLVVAVHHRIVLHLLQVIQRRLQTTNSRLSAILPFASSPKRFSCMPLSRFVRKRNIYTRYVALSSARAEGKYEWDE